MVPWEVGERSEGYTGDHMLAPGRFLFCITSSKLAGRLISFGLLRLIEKGTTIASYSHHWAEELASEVHIED